MVTKSGTNSFHGEAFEYFRDASLNHDNTFTEQALQAAGKEKGVLIVSVDGGCTGIKNIKDGTLGATAQQYPLLMAAKGVRSSCDASAVNCFICRTDFARRDSIALSVSESLWS